MPPKLTGIIMGLVAIIASALASRKSEDTELASAQNDLAAANVNIADLHSQLDAVGAPLTDEQKAQIKQLFDAAHAATPAPDVAPPAVVNIGGDVSLDTTQGVVPVASAAPAEPPPAEQTPVEETSSAAAAGDSTSA